MNEDDDEVEPDEEDASRAGGEGAEAAESNEGDGKGSGGGFRMPAGFSRSLMPNMDDYLASIVAPLREQMSSLMPDYSTLAREALVPMNERFREQMTSIVASVPTFSTPVIDLPALHAPILNPATQEMLKRISEQQAKAMEGLRDSLGPLFDPELLRGFNRALLPPNLKSYADEIRAHQVHQFLEQDGIPLYLVPRGRTALRLLRAQDRSARHRVLSACYESIIDDCSVVLEKADRAVVGDELEFALDGLGAMRAGHSRSAQAMFTVTLDTLIYRFYPDHSVRKVITNRRKDADVPDAIDEMGVHGAMVWLPIWNAHEQFWKHKGDEVPRHYSRHASVHGVSSRQFSKRNCVQVLMLVTSLIGYADRMAREPC